RGAFPFQDKHQSAFELGSWNGSFILHRPPGDFCRHTTNLALSILYLWCTLISPVRDLHPHRPKIAYYTNALVFTDFRRFTHLLPRLEPRKTLVQSTNHDRRKTHSD